jgi:hypothetical protein
MSRKGRPTLQDVLGDYFHQHSGGQFDHLGNQIILYDSIQENIYKTFPVPGQGDRLLLKLERYCIRKGDHTATIELMNVISLFLKKLYRKQEVEKILNIHRE